MEKLKNIDNEKIKLESCLIVVSGRPLSGKGYTCNKLNEIYDLRSIDIDEVRNDIDETRRNGGEVVLLEEKKEAEIITKAYIELCRRAKSEIILGKSVLISGTFSRDELKDPLRDLVDYVNKMNIPFKIFLLTTNDDNVVMERIEKRVREKSLSNIDSMEKYIWSKGFFKKIDFAPIVEIDTTEEDYLVKVENSISNSFLRKKELKLAQL